MNASPPEDHGVGQAKSAAALASAFSEFISASARLENSYRHLQQEVYELRQELSARNAALTTSMAENERMRLDLQQIVDSMPCGVLVLDGKGDISMINPESGRLLGLDGSQFRAAPQSNLRQISASNPPTKMRPTTTQVRNSAFTSLQENVGWRFAIGRFSIIPAKQASLTRRLSSCVT